MGQRTRSQWFRQHLLTVAVMVVAAPSACWGITTYGDPDSYLAPAGTVVNSGLPNEINLDGVVRLLINTPGVGTVGCSGALLYTGMHVLTAAHCVDETVVASGVSVEFVSSVNPGPIAGSAIYIPSGWDDELLDGFDIALITLSAPATGVPGYYLYASTDEIGQTGDISGFGRSGTGLTGQQAGTFGTRRAGQNEYDATADEVFLGGSANILLGDFDDDTDPDTNTLLTWVLSSTGLGASEVMVASGDSGGPTFLGGRLAGVHSFIGNIDPELGDDIDFPTLNATFGEVFGDTRVSGHAAWIEELLVPEPGTFLLLGAGLAGLALLRRRRQPRS